MVASETFFRRAVREASKDLQGAIKGLEDLGSLGAGTVNAYPKIHTTGKACDDGPL